MRPPLFLCCLLLLGYSAPCRSDFMVLGGPALGLNDGAPECTALLQEKLQVDLKSLRETGVSHVRVPLPTDALHSEAWVSCFHTLLSSVTEAGLQPVVMVDLSWLSPGAAVFPGSKSGSDMILRSSLQSQERLRLDLVLAELGRLAHTWVFLLEGNQGELYTQVQQIFRRHFPNPEYRISFGLKSDLSVTSDLSQLPMDFLSLKVKLDCGHKGAPSAVSYIKKLSGHVPVLIYNFETNQCSERQVRYFTEQLKSELNIVGCDTAAILEQSVMRVSAEDRHFFSPSVRNLNASDIPSKSKAVWERFSSWTTFQTRLYYYNTFPQNFLWGVMSSAYQIEGGHNADGKGESIWDTFTHQIPSNIPEYATGDVACDSYNKLEQDLDMIRASEVKSYRFSISWSRLFANGTIDIVNSEGVEYYNRLIDGLLNLNVTPMVTLYHWDLPQALQDVGGWENSSIIEHFNDYAEFCFKNFGNRVKFWITFNDPFTIAWKGYGSGEMPPNLNKNPGTVPYQVGHILLKAHATVYHTYDTYRPTQKGLVSIALNGDWYEPVDVNSPRELETVDRAMQFRLGWFAHPIFINGDYPEAMKFQVKAKSHLQGLEESRLPTFTEEEKAMIRGTADVFCLNHHTTKTTKYSTQQLTPHSYQFDWDLVEEELTQFPQTGIQGPRAVPWGLRRVLNWIKQEYGDPEVYITDNSMGVERWLNTDDFNRVFFLKSYIDEALKAQSLDGVQLRGYVGVPIMDSFEWLQGYIMGSGLNYVDFADPARNRTAKYSSHVYKDIIRQNGFPPGEDETPLEGHFRDDMMWSTATASFQIEGGWRADGKGLSVWDQFSHTPGKVRNGDNGDIACDSYNRMDEDIRLLQEVGVKYYRFSVAWARVLPKGTLEHINEPGVAYYQRLVRKLEEVGIQPQVTLFHWDLPQALEDVGGWQNESTVAHFRDYSDLMFSRLGQRVKVWITFNEPWIVCTLGYGYGSFAPGVSSGPGSIPYVVGHNLLKAHAESWHLYNDKYRALQQGQISITLNSDWAEPRNPYKPEDVAFANRYLQFFLGWFAHPIFKGDYPPIMKTVIRERSLANGLTESRLPEFTPEEVARINGTHDYFGLNHYTSVLIFPIDYPTDAMVYDADRGTGSLSDWNWLESGSAWLRVTPFGLRKLLKFIKEEYGNPQVIITENGVSETGPVQDLNDAIRQHYYTEYINQVLKAHLLDGVDVRGYTAWSLMDNFEWAEGYNERFGLVYVNRSDPALPRTPKVSVQTYNRIIRCNGFPGPESGHECLQTPTTTPPVTVPPPVASNISLSFLGMELTAEQAEVGLNTTFALLIVSCVAALLAGVGLFMCRRRSKKSVTF